MKVERIDLYEYFGKQKPCGAEAFLTAYLHEVSAEYSSNRMRPAMLIIPGGAYCHCADTEAEPIAIEFLSKGFNTFVLNYSVKDHSNVEYPYQLLEGCMAIAYIRENTKNLAVNPEKICSAGFSAGGHLCAMLATLTGEGVVKEFFNEKASLCRPDAVVLSYPVISSELDAGRSDSIKMLCGDREDLQAYLSLEKRVDKNSVPAFIWSTAEDKAVLCDNSLLMALSYKKAGVPFELHVFEKGEHGLSLATEEVCKPLPANAVWVEMALTWLKNRGFKVKD